MPVFFKAMKDLLVEASPRPGGTLEGWGAKHGVLQGVLGLSGPHSFLRHPTFYLATCMVAW